MDTTTWKRLRRAAMYVPLAMAATCPGVPAEEPALHGAQEAGTWSFFHEHVLGTSLEVKIQAASFAQAQNAEVAALRKLDRQDRILSAWRTDSEFARWRATRFRAVPVSPELFDTLAAFDFWREQTGGALDASAEAALALWRQALQEQRTPSQAEIANAVEAMTQPHWQLDAAQHTATRLTDTPLALASFTKSRVSAQAATAAMRAGATGVMLNVGGDVVVRGTLTQVVDIADPNALAENTAAVDRIVVQNAAVATSGSYRRAISAVAALGTSAPRLSHIVDPRTAQPTGHVLSSTVIASDAATAGALATAFSVLTPEESEQLAARTPGVEYLLLLPDGRRQQSAGWTGYQAPGLRPAVYAPAVASVVHAVDAGAWNPSFGLNIAFDLPRIEDARYRRPYVAVWIEDADRFPVRTLALWTQNPRWLPELKQWYREDQIRNLSEGTDVSRTISSATRPPGNYLLKWDGKDNEGKLVKAGKYTVVIEASREHGGYQVERHVMDFAAQPQQATLQPGTELGKVTLDYGKR